jgi:hypothetical protein
MLASRIHSSLLGLSLRGTSLVSKGLPTREKAMSKNSHGTQLLVPVIGGIPWGQQTFSQPSSKQSQSGCSGSIGTQGNSHPLSSSFDGSSVAQISSVGLLARPRWSSKFKSPGMIVRSRDLLVSPMWLWLHRSFIIWGSSRSCWSGWKICIARCPRR